MNRTMERLFSGNVMVNNGPDVDIIREEECVKIEIELAGVQKENVEVSCVDNKLKIKVVKPIPERKEGVKIISAQRKYGELEMEFTVNDIDVSKIEADMKDSVLVITLPFIKKEEPKTATITVK